MTYGELGDVRAVNGQNEGYALRMHTEDWVLRMHTEGWVLRVIH